MQMYHPKTTASALGGALSLILIAELARHGLSIDATEGSALTLIVSYVCGYFAPDSDTTQSEIVAESIAKRIPPMTPNPLAARVPSPSPAIEQLREQSELTIPPRQPEGGVTAAVVAAAFLALSLLSACAALSPT